MLRAVNVPVCLSVSLQAVTSQQHDAVSIQCLATLLPRPTFWNSFRVVGTLSIMGKSSGLPTLHFFILPFKNYADILFLAPSHPACAPIYPACLDMLAFTSVLRLQLRSSCIATNLPEPWKSSVNTSTALTIEMSFRALFRRAGQVACCRWPGGLLETFWHSGSSQQLQQSCAQLKTWSRSILAAVISRKWLICVLFKLTYSNTS